MPDSYRYAPPEITASGWEGIKKGPTYAVDAYDYGLMIYEAYNGAVVESGLLSRALNVPVAMAQAYKRLIILNPKSRLSIAHFLEQGKKPGSYFDTPLIRMTDNVESLGLKNENEREQFLRYDG